MVLCLEGGSVRRAVLFDLDDTLYRELDFVESAFREVAGTLAQCAGVPVPQAVAALADAFTRFGRDRTIDRAVEALGLQPALVPQLVRVYRSHVPAVLHLHADARRALDRLAAQGILLGLVTDGDPDVQRSKTRALGLERWLGAMRFTWDEGAERQKPHARAFLPALETLGLAGDEAVYIGDNPAKDFVGARALGMHTVRVLRGPHSLARAVPGYDADLTVDTLDGFCGVGIMTGAGTSVPGRETP